MIDDASSTSSHGASCRKLISSIYTRFQRQAAAPCDVYEPFIGDDARTAKFEEIKDCIRHALDISRDLTVTAFVLPWETARGRISESSLSSSEGLRKGVM